MMKGRVIRALGAMSGTSLDGVDAAVIETDGVTIAGFGPTAYRGYSNAERATLRAALGRWPGEVGVAEAAAVVEAAHAELLGGIEGADVVGFHGQTLAHAPEGGRTHQAGDGRVLANALSLPVVWDFRSSDMEMGGEGAPLAPAYHFALAKWAGLTAPVVFLNLGGVGNMTWLDPRKDRVEEEGAILAFDTGPANAPLNDMMQARFGKSFDKDGALAATGNVVDSSLELFLMDTYFARLPPKSLDRDAFAEMVELVAELDGPDAAATLTAMTAAAVMKGMEHCPAPPARVLVTGGGRHNPVMMGMIAAALDCPVEPVEVIGIDGDMLEAQAFAYLAVRVLNGLPTSFQATTGVRAAIGGGQISRPVAQ